MYALTEQGINCFGETAYKLRIFLIAAAVFFTLSLPLGSANESIGILKGYIQENTMLKEHDDALFLREKWMKEIGLKYEKNKVKEITSGIIYTEMTKYINSKKVKIHIAEINRKINPDIEIIPKRASSKMHYRTKINNIIKDEKIFVAVNGTYFKPDTGTPLGALVINKEIITGPIYERAAIGIGMSGYKTARVGFKGSISNSEKEISINNVNQPRMMHSNVLIYTSKWGQRAPVSKNRLKYIAIYGNKIIAKSDRALYIPNEGYVISAPEEKLTGFKVGDKVEIRYNLTPDMEGIEHVISGGPYLMKDGKIYTDTKEEKLSAISGRNPRTAVGYTKDNVFVIVTVDGRKEGSSGVTIIELAKIMRDIGCYEAINLDGGSSTIMYADGNTYKGTSAAYPTLVSNLLTVKIRG